MASCARHSNIAGSLEASDKSPPSAAQIGQKQRTTPDAFSGAGFCSQFEASMLLKIEAAHAAFSQGLSKFSPS